MKNRHDEYLKYKKRKIIILFIFFALVLFSMYFALKTGVAELDFKTMLSLLVKKSGDRSLDIVLWNIRLPRIVASVFAGASLGISGCIMQNNLKNPLASPSTIGVTSAAAFGANFGIIVLGGGSFQSGSSDAVYIMSPYIVTFCAFVSSVIAISIVITISRIKSFSSQVIILAGVAISSLFGAGTTFLQYFADSTHVATAVFWSFGNLGRASWKEIILIGILLLISFIYFMFKSWDYNALINGDDNAKVLGVNPHRTRLGGMFFASILISVCVSFLGIISFVGLIAPQISRRIIGTDHRFLILSSALLGSLILLISDTVARVLFSPIILPVGVITSFLGAPLFLYILMKDYKN